MDGVRLSFAKGSMEAIAELALERSTGARGLRAIMENLMQETMYEIPARKDIAEVVITPDSVRGKKKPNYVLLRDTAPAPKEGA
jgi:ATP-dependent Clp protease ATP-binding subunit ClpX